MHCDCQKSIPVVLIVQNIKETFGPKVELLKSLCNVNNRLPIGLHGVKNRQITL